MARFSDLSSELIVMVSQYVRPDCFIAFSEVSKQLHACLAPFMAEHKRLLRTYVSVTNTPNLASLNPDHGPLVKVIKDVLLTPRIAKYVDNLCIQRWHAAWQTGPATAGTEESRKQETISLQDRFGEVLVSMKHMVPEVVDSWMSAFKSGAEDPVVALLFVLLPNLTTIDLVDIVGTYGCLTRTLRDVAKEPKSRSLSRLESVSISGGTHRWLLLCLEFARLPSLRSIYASEFIESNGSQDNINYTVWPSPYSHVVRLSFIRCHIPPQQLFDMLGYFHSLEHFEYLHTQAVEGADSAAYAPFWIRSSLLAHAKSSLKTLKLNSTTDTKKMPDYMGSLRSFGQLKEVDTDLCCLRSQDLGSRTWTEVLPKSIEKVTVRRSRLLSVASAKLLRELLEKKPPNLREFNFRTLNGPVRVPLREVVDCARVRNPPFLISCRYPPIAQILPKGRSLIVCLSTG